MRTCADATCEAAPRASQLSESLLDFRASVCSRRIRTSFGMLCRYCVNVSKDAPSSDAIREDRL